MIRFPELKPDARLVDLSLIPSAGPFDCSHGFRLHPLPEALARHGLGGCIERFGRFR